MGLQQRFLEELNEEKGRAKGRLRLAAPFTTLYHLLPPVIEEFIHTYNQVQVNILDRSQENVMELVKEGEIDFGFVLESMAPKNLLSVRWRKVEVVLLLPTGHPLASAKQVSLREIAGYPLILPPPRLKYNLRKDLEEKLQARGLDYNIVMESSNVELTAVYVEMGLGVSLVYLAQDLPVLQERKLAYLALSHYFPAEYITVVRRPELRLSSYKQAFLEILLGRASV
jgi:DNA-binding transcriptional LysR family regulator